MSSPENEGNGTLEGTSTHSSPQPSIRTPTLLPADERIVESWIQQSLVMPSATNDFSGDANGVGTADVMNPSTNLRHHRREGSIENYADTGIDSTTWLGESNATISSTTAAETKETNNVVSNTILNHDSRADWGSNSAFNGDDSFFGSASSNFLASSTSLSLNASISGDRLLSVSRVASENNSREEEMDGISSMIHDAARITDWQTVVELCQQQPGAAAYTGKDGWTALHHACNRRCPYPNVVESLIRAYPDALLTTEEKGWLPLHYACRFKAPKDVVRLLLHMYPEKGQVGVSRPDRKGRSPLYYAVRYDAPSGVLGLLLEVDASAVLEEDQNSDSPLSFVWDDWAEKLDGKRTIQKILGGEGDNNSQDNNNSAVNLNFFDQINSPMQDNSETNVAISEKAKMIRKRLKRNKTVFEKWNKVNVF